ncbi:putative Zn-binding protein involved in type VI secretion [Paraburkholderia sp. BL6665CI2N2]|nr:putative Zn-binding protein involved in type VI secretion [Paraburkholderia sp. BL6665CI2N2]
MIDLIRLGDTTDHGGEVITASEVMRYGGVRVARKGDEVTCPLHPEVVPNVIVEGDDRITDHAVPVARQGRHATCGCSLIHGLVPFAKRSFLQRAGAGLHIYIRPFCGTHVPGPNGFRPATPTYIHGFGSPKTAQVLSPTVRPVCH